MFVLPVVLQVDFPCCFKFTVITPVPYSAMLGLNMFNKIARIWRFITTMLTKMLYSLMKPLLMHLNTGLSCTCIFTYVTIVYRAFMSDPFML